ncbi:MAG: bacitracin ABC transporter ATP-binding protein [Candidatus Improbicoccus devescovinae]|nr:MAG: bacitracin ABC transporter ATP-binding protein [Candidatus Improbicoccus devescovinae]
MNEEYLFQTRNLTKVYSKKKIVNDVNLNVKKGSIYGLIGKNGAGKTTLFKMITNLIRPTSGEIEFSPEIQSERNWRSKIGAVIEYPVFYPYLSARQNLHAQRIALGLSNKDVVDELLEIVGLSDVGKKQAKKLSLGMKQRLAIALALVGDPIFLFLDEPINGLDPMGIIDIRNLLLKLHERNVTIVISSHILSELVKIATDYAIINNGELIIELSQEDLKSRLQTCVRVKVNDVQRSINLISDELNLREYKILGNEIKIFTEQSNSMVINSLLAKNDVIVESIYTETGDSEEYFVKLMSMSKAKFESESDENDSENT